MNKKEFVHKIILAVRNSGIADLIEVLIDPPGRSPSKSLLETSAWYNKLDANDKEMLKKIITKAVDETIFGFLCVLDGARSIKDKSGEDHFDLKYIFEDETSNLTDESEEYLHDIYNYTVIHPWSRKFIGKTNLEAANYGYSPQINNEGFARLHHIGQNAKGPLVEANSEIHKFGTKGFKSLHNQFDGKKHPQFPVNHDTKRNNDVRAYWKYRSKNES